MVSDFGERSNLFFLLHLLCVIWETNMSGNPSEGDTRIDRIEGKPRELNERWIERFVEEIS